MEYCFTSAIASRVGGVLPRVYQFKIQLFGIYPGIWRRIQVPSDYNFFALHSAIQDVFRWNSRFTYRFKHFSRRPEIASVMSPLKENIPSYVHDLLIKNYFECEGDTALYEYHFVGQWEILVLLEKITDSVEGSSYPKCVNGQQGNPPETIDGGPQAFQEISDKAANQNDPFQQDHIEQLASMGFSDHFDLHAVEFRDPVELFESTYAL